ncbi:hypothetical protein [Streptomyces sp. NPDC048172]|uniref:hypothetical protein n=1 Tax=Streptomyces sp. NPDC048172 TaxID=3365505 RepID=UPI00371EDE11
MSTYTTAVFGEAPVIRVLRLAADAQWSAGRLDVDDELARLDRTVRFSPEASWAMPMSTLAALLELIADILEADPAHDTPPAFRAALERATEGAEGTEGTDPPGYLRTLAARIRRRADARHVGVRELPLVRWEVEALFPRLEAVAWQCRMVREHPTFTECAQAAIESEHPAYCPEFLSTIAAEAQRLLLLFPAPEPLPENTPTLHWADREVARELLTLATDHMTRHHQD